MEEKIIKKILFETEQGYDLMAQKFSETRSKKFWSDLEFIKNCVQDGDKILDFGCGNGRLLNLLFNKNIEYVGVDISENLLNKAKKNHSGQNVQFLKIDSSQDILPFSDNYFNTIYSIAVFHHIPGYRNRVEIARELHRVLKPGGKIVITVWNLWQEKYYKNILKNWKDKVFAKSDLDWNDCYISFKNNQGQVFKRYHHAFTARELRKLFSTVEFLPEECRIINKKNIIFTGNK